MIRLDTRAGFFIVKALDQRPGIHLGASSTVDDPAGAFNLPAVRSVVHVGCKVRIFFLVPIIHRAILQNSSRSKRSKAGRTCLRVVLVSNE